MSLTRRLSIALLLAIALGVPFHPAEARKAHHRGNLSPVPVAGAMIDDRYPNLRLPEAYGSARAWKQRAKQVRRHVVRRYVPLPKPRPKNLAQGLVQEVAGAFSRPSRFIGGRLICAINVNAALAERGIRGTGSAWAKSFLRWGYPSAPVPGAVAIWHRGRNPKSGHVAIVARVERGRVFYWNPGRRGWRLTAYRRHPITYRVAG